MAEITANGLRVTSLSLAIPRLGAWTADIAVDTDTPLDAPVTLVVDGRTWVGGVVRGGVYAGSWRGRLVGAPGLLQPVTATALRGATLALVLDAVLREAGEASASTRATLDAAAPRWHQHAVRASHAVADVARAAGYAWRVLADGAVWVGAETWPAFTPTDRVDVTDEAPETGRLVLAGDTLGVLPGQTLTLPRRDPARVGYVEHRGTADEMRTTVLLEREGDAASTAGGRLLAAIEAVVARALRRVDYFARYEARVVAQRADGTLDVVPDDTRVPSAQAVPYRTLPGLTYEVQPGARVLLGYVGGLPSAPFVDLWPSDTAAVVVRINGGTAKAARNGDGVARSTAFATWISAVSTATGVAPPSGDLGSINSGCDSLRLP